MDALRRRAGAEMQRRIVSGGIRELRLPHASDGSVLKDFSSNDYLGLARSDALAQDVRRRLAAVEGSRREAGLPFIGSSGSRLLAGHCGLCEEVEGRLAAALRRPRALIFNSGYDLNLSLLGALPQRGDAVVYDELAHNSMIMGMRMGRGGAQDRLSFRHNDVAHLRDQLRSARDRVGDDAAVFVAVESVYSMDGDIAPLGDILGAAEESGAVVIVDEAHATGVYGRAGGGVVVAEGLEGHGALLASVHTFGKALGAHGACVATAGWLGDYLVNCARPFIYSTAPALHTLVAMDAAMAFQATAAGDARRAALFCKIMRFREGLADLPDAALLPSESPIQAVLFPGNERCVRAAESLRARGFDCRPIRAPTVPAGEERIRVILHAHNADEDIDGLVAELRGLLGEEARARARA